MPPVATLLHLERDCSRQIKVFDGRRAQSALSLPAAWLVRAFDLSPLSDVTSLQGNAWRVAAAAAASVKNWS